MSLGGSEHRSRDLRDLAEQGLLHRVHDRALASRRSVRSRSPPISHEEKAASRPCASAAARRQRVIPSSPAVPRRWNPARRLPLPLRGCRRHQLAAGCLGAARRSPEGGGLAHRQPAPEGHPGHGRSVGRTSRPVPYGAGGHLQAANLLALHPDVDVTPPRQRRRCEARHGGVGRRGDCRSLRRRTSSVPPSPWVVASARRHRPPGHRRQRRADTARTRAPATTS